jgi:hypothetical protein
VERKAVIFEEKSKAATLEAKLSLLGKRRE